MAPPPATALPAPVPRAHCRPGPRGRQCHARTSRAWPRHSPAVGSLIHPNRIRAYPAERTSVTPLRPRPVLVTAATAVLGLAGAAMAAYAVHPEFLAGEQAYTA